MHFFFFTSMKIPGRNISPFYPSSKWTPMHIGRFPETVNYGVFALQEAANYELSATKKTKKVRPYTDG